ncbi:MAG: hypothetical protein NTW75_08395 [Planctomycetales bacterium]|nr:hypothetical protein [Planctomycetales bacterium]
MSACIVRECRATWAFVSVGLSGIAFLGAEQLNRASGFLATRESQSALVDSPHPAIRSRVS